MEVKRCANCMEDLINIPGYVCPKCNFDNSGDVVQPVMHAMSVNTVLHGRYLIGRVLGQGGFGLTYIGYDLSLDVKVAVKEFFPKGMVERDRASNDLLWNQDCSDTQQRMAGYENFQKEARKIAKIDTIPSIVRVRDVFFEHETAYIVMDYVEGMTLKERIQKNGPMTYSECIRLLTPMMNDLEKVHRMGLIHRDISPDNIMVSPDGTVKLLDLGAAMDLSAGQRMQSQLVAKKGFSPLEQYTGEGKIGTWTDVYALCATIYYCITGRTIPSALDRMNNRVVMYPINMREKLKPAQKAALDAGLVLDHRKRIQTVSQLLKRLGRIVLPVPWKKLAIAGGAAAAALLVFFIAGNLIGPARTVTVEQIGTTNSNMNNGGYFGVYPDEYEYVIAPDQGLYLCEYDQNDKTFYIDDTEKISEWATYITLGNDKVYYVEQDNGKFSICGMEKSGENVETLCASENSRQYRGVQYVKLSDEREYLYYLLTHEKGAVFADLYRYDLKKKKEELLVEGNLNWYNLQGDSLYYIKFSESYDDGSVIRSNLDGEKQKLLITDSNVSSGFIEEETLYLWSLKNETLMAYDLEGKPKSGADGFYDLHIDSTYAISYLDGWILYTNRDDGSMHRIRANGTGDTQIISDHNAMSISDVGNGWFFFWEQAPTGLSRQSVKKVYMAYKDGTELEEFTFLGQEYIWDLPNRATEIDLKYEDAEDGSGVVITGYNTSEVRYEIPDELDGKPVVGIGEGAFEESSIEEIGLPEGLKFIEDNAFFKCGNLTFAGLPSTLESIGNYAFAVCGELTQASLPDGVKSIGMAAFGETSLSEVHIPAAVSYLGPGAFAVYGESGLQEFTVDEENEYYWTDGGALFGVQDGKIVLKAVPSGISGLYTIPDDTAILESYCFAHCSRLTGVEIPASVSLIRENVFAGVSFTDISVSENCRLEGELGNTTDGGEINITYY